MENNGGCDKNAECTQTGPNQVSCFLEGLNSYALSPRPKERNPEQILDQLQPETLQDTQRKHRRQSGGKKINDGGNRTRERAF